MTEKRLNPDDLLVRVQTDEARAHRGKLKIFFGYAAGVGKTYAMLEAARRERASGLDVVVGYVEPHGRPETESLLQGLEAVPPRLIAYRGVTLREFDLDAALARHPALILVDELAHTNAEGSRHAKRWQDVEELLRAGIDVFTTLNVQHIESINDVIAQITGIVVRETLPDTILEQADDIELVDITPEELMERLREGKIYVPLQAERALHHFFQKTNLLALRELSLRQVAQRLSKDVAAARFEKDAQGPWATSERLLVCVGPSPTSAKLIRTAKRMAAAFGAEWLAVAVEARGEPRESATREKIAQRLRLAEQLGAEVHTLISENVPQTILDYARSRNVTKIVVGKTAQPWWSRLVFGTVIDQLLEKSGDIDIYVIRGEPEATIAVAPLPRAAPIAWGHYLATTVIVALCAGVGALGHFIHEKPPEADTVMIFLFGVGVSALWFGRGPAIFASISSVLVFDFFFVKPYFSFSVDDAQYFLTFAVMLAIGLVISTLTARLREQLSASQSQERRTAALYRFTKQLSEIAGVEFLINSAGKQLREIFGGEVVLYVRLADGPVSLRFGDDTTIAQAPINAIVAQWVADHDQIAGVGTDTLPNASALFVPLVGSQRTVGALGVRPDDPQRFLDPEQRRLLESCASLMALSVERDQSVLEAHEAQLRVQTERLRNSLLSSVSHDLRTPLAAIAGTAESLLATASNQHDPSQQELLQAIVDEAQRLSRLVDNLLDMTRLEAGAVALNKQWHVLEEIVGSARNRLRRELEHHQVRVDIPGDLPLLLVDEVLIEQTLGNILENAARYTPPGSKIDITARTDGKQVTIRIADNGPGLPPGSEGRVFEKFYHGATKTADGRRGVGLGLSICQAVATVHGGTILARNRPGGGAEFELRLPCEQIAPRVAMDEASFASKK
jgi:two-component system, OmpR family, sensor histidine kinase KdpD